MNPDIQRAQFYMNQKRYKEAQTELAKAIASQPDNSRAHTMLGYCLHRSGDKVSGRKEAAIGVSLDPTSSYAHRMLGHICFELGDQKAADQAVREAIRLSPHDANAYGILALSLGWRAKWKESLSVAETGLEINPNEVNCVNARSQALSVIGGKADTAQAVQAALQENSQDPLAQTYAGWAMLRQGKSKEALDHFREALRLDPNREDAREGMLEALRARFPFYRILIGWSKLLLRLPPGSRQVLVFGLYVVARGSMALAGSYPRIRPVVYPLAGAYLLFVLFILTVGPLINIALLAHPLGRIALSREERKETMAMAILFGLSLASVVAGLIMGRDLALMGGAMGAIFFVLVSILTHGDRHKGKTRLICLASYTGVALVLLLGTFGVLYKNPNPGG